MIAGCPHLAGRPPFLCAGAANNHFSRFSTQPCFSILCAGAVNTRLYVKLCQKASARAGLAAQFFVRRRGKYAYFVFLPCPLLLSFVRRRFSYATSVRVHDHASTRRPFFVVRRRSEYAHLVFLDSRGHPWLLRSCAIGPYRGPLGVLTASLDDPSRSSGAFLVPPGTHCDHVGCSRCFP